MKKFTKIMTVVFAVVMVFSVASTAFAYYSDAFPGNEWNQSKFGVLRDRTDRNSVYGCQRIVGVSADGAYGKDSAAAVRNFQRNNGKPVDGVVGTATWTAMRNVISCREVLSNHSGWTITPGGYTAFLHYNNGTWHTWTRNNVEVIM